MDAYLTTRTVTISIASMAIQGLAGMACRECGAPLDVCQPDPNLPDRFLATCPDCLTWFLIETTGDQATAWIASLSPVTGLAGPAEFRRTSP